MASDHYEFFELFTVAEDAKYRIVEGGLGKVENDGSISWLDGGNLIKADGNYVWIMGILPDMYSPRAASSLKEILSKINFSNVSFDDFNADFPHISQCLAIVILPSFYLV